MAPAINDVLKVAARFKYSAAYDLANVYHFLVVAKEVAATTSELVTAVQTWLDAIWTPMATFVNNQVDPYDLKIDVTTIDPGTGKEMTTENIFLGPWTMAVPPGSAGDALPLPDAMILTLRTARPKTRGRKFYAGAEEGASTLGGTLFASTYATMTTVAANHLLDAKQLGAGPYPWILKPGVLSIYNPPTYFFPFTSAVASNVFGTHRSRRKGVGS